MLVLFIDASLESTGLCRTGRLNHWERRVVEPLGGDPTARFDLAEVTSMIQRSDRRYGVDARNRSSEASTPGLEGARAALETFYFAFNHRDAQALALVWSHHTLAQLNNPLGGILRGGDAVAELYGRIFSGPVRVEVEFSDIIEYAGATHVLFAGHESGTYKVPGREATPLLIRTSRHFSYDADDKRWQQLHHHGSIDEPDALRAYQHAILTRT
jgi:SnoaL-like domain